MPRRGMPTTTCKDWAPLMRWRQMRPAVGPERALTAMARYLNDRAASIYGGSNEIQRDIMARLVLGL